MTQSTNHFASVGLVPVSLDIPQQDAKLVLPPCRLGILHERVHRGALFLRYRLKTSAWITEARSPEFTISHLRHRSLWSTEESYFASVFRTLSSARIRPKSGLSATIHFGFDIEDACTSQSLHFKVMDDLWRNEASLALDILMKEY